MKKSSSEHYPLVEIVDQSSYTLKDLLHYGEIGELEICIFAYSGLYKMHEGEWSIEKELYRRKEPYYLSKFPGKMEFLPGDFCPIFLMFKDWVSEGMLGQMHFSHPEGLIAIKHPQKKAYLFLTKKDYDTSMLYIAHREKLRFEKKYPPIKAEMGTEERENLLRLIGAFIEKYYQGKAYRKNGGLPNASAISKEFHGWLIDNHFSEKGMSESTFTKLIPKAYNLTMENKEEKPASSFKLKKIPPS